jgi:hypothetical protein
VSRVSERVTHAVEAAGEIYTITSTAHTGLFEILPDIEAADYLTAAQISAAKRPLYRVWTAHDDTSAESDTVTWNSMSLNILSAVDLRIYGATQARVLILEEL